MAKKKRPGKAEIKRQIAQFLAQSEVRNQMPEIRPPIIEQSEARAVPNPISEEWSQTTTAEIKKIAIVLTVLLAVLVGFTIADRKFALVEKLGRRIANLIEL